MTTKARTATPTMAVMTIQNEAREADRSRPGTSSSLSAAFSGKRPHDACIAILATVGKARLPSLRIVTAQLAQTIQNTKGVPSSNEHCARLADTLCRFQFLVNTIGRLDKKSQGKVEKPFHNALKQVERTLRDLDGDLRRAQGLGNEAIRTFFTAHSDVDRSASAYIGRIEESIMNLKDGLCVKGYKEEKLDKELGHVSGQLKKDFVAVSSSTEVGAFTMINNLAEENMGTTFEGMGFIKGMEVNIHDNTAKRNKKDAFSNIKFNK